MLLYWLIGLVPVAAIAYIFWAHRKKAVDHANAREERMAQILGASRQRDPSGAAALAVSSAAAPATEITASAYRGKSRFLGQRHVLFYYLLKSALPDHDVFAHVSLAAVLEVAPQLTGAARDDRTRAIAQLAVDFLVCSKAMGMTAAIDLAPGGAPDATRKSECLKAAGVRYVRIDPARLPRRDNVRTLVLGASA